MADETLKIAPASELPATAAELPVVSDVPEAENGDASHAAAPEEAVIEAEKEKITESASFKEETNVAGQLPDPQKTALDELKLLVQQALNNHDFNAKDGKPATAVEEEEAKPSQDTSAKDALIVSEPAEPVVEPKGEEKTIPPPPPAVEKSESSTDTEASKKIESVEETINKPTEPATEETEPPEEVFIWGIPLLADERSDAVLLKFLRARDFKVKDAFNMLKNVVAWRKEFGIESLLEEDLGTEQDKVVYMHGVDKEGHPVCYNAYGEYQNKELYTETFSDEQKRTIFLRWRIQFLEKSIRKLDFSPDGVCTIVQVNDLKNSPGPFKRELRQTTNQALQLLQDNYPEFVAKQVFINVPWWYLTLYKMINPFFTQRSKSKFVFAGPSKTAETLFKYIAPELVPVQYGGLSREGEHEFTTSDTLTLDIISPATKHIIHFPAPQTCTLVWEARVVGYEVSYGAEFVPSAEEGYTVIVQKSRKIAASSDEAVICGSFKCGEPGQVVLTFNNQTSKKKKVLYRYKNKAASD